MGTYKVSDQKIFYIIYIDSILDENLENEINLFEKVLSIYRKDEDLSDARKLINTRFKEVLDIEINLQL
ncbi:hypothetical protein JCM19298_937 [Nonlabens ulvanivorans]|nr:hypothetical protein [Nonlabens ulvanivorans]GAK95160.1 hypothetical protein JCM19298_937 [Nonlabens ulvanivorans]